MACDLATLSQAPTCTQYASPTKQLQALLLLLNAAQDNTDWNTLLEEAKAAGLGCLSPAQLKAKTATIICQGLEVDCDILNCFTPQDLAALLAYLTCTLIDSINP